MVNDKLYILLHFKYYLVHVWKLHNVIPFWWQGIEPRVLWIGIGGSIFFGVLEKTKSILTERNSRRRDAKLKL
jgi:hypothetical protein